MSKWVRVFVKDRYKQVELSAEEVTKITETTIAHNLDLLWECIEIYLKRSRIKIGEPLNDKDWQVIFGLWDTVKRHLAYVMEDYAIEKEMRE